MNSILCISTALCMLVVPPKTDSAIMKGKAVTPRYLKAAMLQPAPVYRYDNPLMYRYDDRWPSIRYQSRHHDWEYWHPY
jgi:hypothetical protein